MEKLFSDTLYILKKVNATLPEPVVSEKDLDEEKENIEDYRELTKTLSNIITDIQSTDLQNDKAKLIEEIFELYISYSNILWHVQQIYELIIKTMVALPTDSLGELDASHRDYAEYCDESRRKSINKLDKTLEKMIKIIERISSLLSKHETEKTTLSQKKIYIKNFFSLRSKLLDDMHMIQRLLR